MTTATKTRKAAVKGKLKDETVKEIAPKIIIARPNFQIAKLTIVGISPYVQHAFSQKSMNTMMEGMMKGSQTRKGKAREAKNFKEAYEGATHFSNEGWIGIPAAAIRNAMISACRTVGFKMTLAKLSLFVEPNGFDRSSRDPLIKITKGKPHEHFASARNSNGSTDIRCRPMWDPGWEAVITIKWDADQFSATDIVNLLARVGAQVGIGEGRADSRNSAGMGWGHFEVRT